MASDKANAAAIPQVVNAALRRALSPRAARYQPYQLTPHHSALQPGVERANCNRLADELEDEAINPLQ